MARGIPISDLHPCDVLLYHGNSAVSQVIQWFSGSEYDHASIFDGSMVVEALAVGVTRREVGVSVVCSIFVDVWRMKKEGNFIGSHELPDGPVLDVADRYASVRHKASREDLLMSAIDADPNFITPGDLRRTPDFTKVSSLLPPS